MTSMFIAIALNGRVRKQYMLITAIAASMLMMLPQSFCPPYVAFLAANYLCGVALGVIDTLVSAQRSLDNRLSRHVRTQTHVGKHVQTFYITLYMILAAA